MSKPLDTVYWMGGSPCSGKSSISQLLAAKYQLKVYHCDDHFYRQMAAADPQTQPSLRRLNGMSWDALFSRPPEVQLEDEIQIYRELFPTILGEVHRLAADGPLLAEGAALLPELVEPLRIKGSRVIYVVPTPAFQNSMYAQREWRYSILQECRDPEQAFANWMARDEAFARWVTDQARALGMGVLTVSGQRTITENAAIVAAYFGLDGTEQA